MIGFRDKNDWKLKNFNRRDKRKPKTHPNTNRNGWKKDGLCICISSISTFCFDSIKNYFFFESYDWLKIDVTSQMFCWNFETNLILKYALFHTNDLIGHARTLSQSCKTQDGPNTLENLMKNYHGSTTPKEKWKMTNTEHRDELR
jgi:hypothetical protein